jgi:hypothetical protein
VRDDMFKVIVERPRRACGAAIKSDGRRFRNSEDAPAKLGMRRGYCDRKYLNENLAPLRRFLASQVGRPWSKVYAELSAGIDRRSTVQEHIYSHINDFVAIHTEWDERGVSTPNNGQCVRVIEPRWYGSNRRLTQSRFELFVHPRTGLLLRNRYYTSLAASWRENLRAKRQTGEQDRIVLSQRLEIHRIDNVWYEIEFTPYPALPKGVSVPHWDVLAKALVAGAEPDRYACRKRQIGSKEIAVIKKAHPGLFSYQSSGVNPDSFTILPQSANSRRCSSSVCARVAPAAIMPIFRQRSRSVAVLSACVTS